MKLERLTAALICGFARITTGMRANWCDVRPEARQRVYFANHSSHGDFVLIWAALPGALRRRTRPVARADYWRGGALRRFVAERVFHGVLIETSTSRQNPNGSMEQMDDALAAGDSLIIFPEGTRNLDEGLLPFKNGIYRLAAAHPDIEFVPVWIENLGRVMPKGSWIPVPLLCTLYFGTPLSLEHTEDRIAFIARARSTLLALAPNSE